jgi:hypothetical protein
MCYLSLLQFAFGTIPPSVGYVQNPLSVYYCYDVEGSDSTQHLKKCIAEVCVIIQSNPIRQLPFTCIIVLNFKIYEDCAWLLT